MILVNTGGGKPQIEILSIGCNKANIAYSLNPNIRVTYYDFPAYRDDIKAVNKHYKRFYIKSKVFLYKLIFLIKFHRFVGTSEILQRRLNVVINKNQYDFVINNTWGDFYPYKSNNTKYVYLMHNSYSLKSQYLNQKYFRNLKNFDTLILLTDKELDIWQRYHSNVKVIPNFLPTIPQVATNHSQKVVLSVGRMSSEKGFLRLLDIWKAVQDSITCHTERSEVSKSRESKINNESMTQERMGESHRFAKSKRIVSDSQVAKMDSSPTAQNDESGLDCHDSALPNLAMTTPHPSLRGEAEASVRSTDPHLQIHKSNLNEWKLIIVGDGVLKSEIESKIRALNLGESVLLKPFTKDIEREYLGASIYAMASHFEGFGMVLAEASSYELPCIAFDIATGPSDIIEHNKSGFLIADNDLQGYAEKLIALMSDESMRKRFGNEAKKIVEKRFSKEVIMEKWREVFDELKS